MPFVLGPALSMKAIHGSQAKNDKIDAHKIAARLRGGMLPQASVYPAEMRATRALWRRRPPLMRTRAERLAHVHNTKSQDNLPEIGKKIAYTANREGGAERFADPAVHKNIAGDLALIPDDDTLLQDLELAILKTAKPHDATTLDLLPTVPGIGKLLSRVLLYEIHDLNRCPRVQDFASSCRLVKCAKAAAGKRLGTSGKKIGKAHLKWAFSEAAPVFLRHTPDGQRLLARLENKHGKGQALTILAHKLARAVYSLLKRQTAFDMAMFLRTEGAERVSRAPNWTTQGDEPLASTRYGVLRCVFERYGVPRPFLPEPCPLIGHPLWLLHRRRESHSAGGCCPAPEPGTHWRGKDTQPALCIGRYEGTEVFLGRSGSPQRFSAIVTKMTTEPRDVCGAAIRGWHLDTEIKSEHQSDCRLRQTPQSGKQAKNRSQGKFVS